MSRATETLRHPALAPARGATLDALELSDRARLGIVLQAAGLLSLCEVAGWRLADGFHSARVDGEGRLSGMRVEPGCASAGAAPALLELLGLVFRAERGVVAGRGEARRAARAVAARWAGVLGRLAADAAVADLLAEAPFLVDAPQSPNREALDGALVRDGVEVPWRAGRGHALSAGAEDAAELVGRGRWSAAVRAFHARPPVDAAERLAFARALEGSGRIEAALAILVDREDPEALALRAECQVTLGELGPARQTVRRLEALDLSVCERLAAGDVVLRVLANSGEAERAADWAAGTVAAARGADRLAAGIQVALAAGDRGDVQAMVERLARIAEPAGDSALAGRWHEAMGQLALLRGDGVALARHAERKLALGRRRMRRVEAGRTWSQVGTGRSLERRFGAAERAFEHAAHLLRGCDGPLALTLAAWNLADVRLRLGKLEGIEPILEAGAAWNRRSGNLRGQLEDELLWIRWELVRGHCQEAVDRCRALAERRADLGMSWCAGRADALEARALGWLGRAGEAREALDRVPEEALGELEPEELPFLFAFAGATDLAVERAARSGLERLASALVRGEPPPLSAWRTLDGLEPYRRARFVLDAEMAAPGAAPSQRREEAVALLRRMGASEAATRLERSRTVAWRALAAYLERPSGNRAAVEALLEAVGHPEAELSLRAAGEERILAGRGGRELGDERIAPLGDAELVLRANEIDEPLRALFALFLRELPQPPDPAAPPAGGEMVGDSPALRAAVARLRRFAPTGLPVLVLGENGTGKELAAREVHRASARSGPFVPLNCAGLTESLLLAELFGHARGAFTGAERERAGIFETARGGTAFLDEIGDLPLAAQGSLLRVLQEREVRRLGESLPRRVDVRFVAATNRDLAALVEDGKFRQDLYFRLKAATVVLPPLRERGRDVLLLAEHFLAGARRRRPGLRLSSEARRALAAYAWPGNVRELENALAAAAALTEDGRIAPEHLDLSAAPEPPKRSRPGDYHALVEAFRRRLIQESLASCDGNLAAAARNLGVTRQYLSQFVRRHGLVVG